MPFNAFLCRFKIALAVGALLSLGAPPGTASPDTVTVFAAASLRDALVQIERDFEAATGHDLVVSLAGSSLLARQIQQGAPVDVFISADVAWMDVLQQGGWIDAASRVDLLGNGLVIVGHRADAVAAPAAVLSRVTGHERIAMALVDAVPAGRYGKAALQSLGVWETLRPQVVQGDNVRSALALVARGEAAYGIVYASDAVADPGVHRLADFPPDSHPPIRYPAARVAGRAGNAGRAFLAFLQGPQARLAFEAQGFTVLAGSE
ncbi:unnamed protein product [Cyprideis torosa]|uniref:Uncharacterized protein n=1 Tax=Cyprideis torosa TaxID=163714 RepID=A0A7R8WY69_9CRUS|nr:unnamed protein product [Cyprideis torosa]CAG0909170.1 unnamed protein product [Cyprideis torosa]